MNAPGPITGTVTTVTEAAAAVAAACPGTVHLPDGPGYPQASMPWNVAFAQTPAAVATPRTVEELSQVVREAERAGLRIAAQTTGHAAAVLAQHDLADVVLVRTGALEEVHIDPEQRVARVGSGCIWDTVIEAAAPHGLTAMHGSAPDVGVVGYLLGGGLSFYGRRHGLAVNSVRAVELVGPGGEVLRADATQHQDLFWALRGSAGGNFGVVTSVEIDLLPIADVYGGMLLWPLDRAPEVVPAWAAWCEQAPAEATTSLRAMRFPPIPDLPDFLRGREVLVVDGAIELTDEGAAEVLAGLRALDPELDTFARMPAAGLTRVHMDPEQPTPAVGGGIVLDRLDERAIATFLELAGPGVDAPVLFVELRHLGGALGAPPPGAGAVGHLAGSHLLMTIAIAPDPEVARLGEAYADRIVGAFGPWAAARSQFLNLAERPIDPASAFTEEAWERLCRIRAELDPAGTFVAAHPIPHR